MNTEGTAYSLFNQPALMGDRINETETLRSNNSQDIMPNMSGRAVREEIPNRKTCNLVGITVIGIFCIASFGCVAGAYLFFDSTRKLMVISGDPDAQSEFYLGVVLLALSFLVIFKVTVAREFNHVGESNRFESVV